jgi:hypothetical protein
MFTRRFKQGFARLCIALLCMHAVTSAYACPAFMAGLPAAASAQDERARHAASTADCGEHAAREAADRNMCHEHYAGDRSVGSPTLASGTPPLALPILFLAPPEPVAAPMPTALQALLQRSTAPPLSIRFQVLRI